MIFTPTRTLLAANLLAAAGCAALWITPQGQVRNIQWAAPAPLMPEIGALPKIESAAFSSEPAFYAATVERPLFSPDRRGAPPAPVDAPAAVADSLSEAHLFGLIAGDEPFALIRAEGKLARLRLNQTVGQWVLTAVGDREATFTRGPETRVLKLEYATLNVASQNTAVTLSASPVVPPALVSQMAENIKRQNDEQAEREARVAAMRAKLAAKKP